MGANDRAQADALDRAWDELIGRTVPPHRGRPLAHGRAAVPLRLAVLDRATATGSGRAPAWSEVAGRFEHAPARGRRRRRRHAAETTPTSDTHTLGPAVPAVSAAPAVPIGRR